MFHLKRWCGVFLLAAVTCSTSMGAEILEDFDAYAPGGGVSGQSIWTTWDGTGPDGVVSTEQASSGAQSLKVIGGNDVVGSLGNKATGIWEFALKVFVPADHVGQSFIILMSAYAGDGDYSGSRYVWAIQMELNGTSTFSDGLASLPLVTDAWSDVKVTIDLNTNKRTITYNGAALGGVATWAGSGPVAISVVDLYSDGAASAVYYDDVTLTDLTPDASTGWTVAQSGVAGRFDHVNPSVRGASAALDGFEPGYVVNGSGGDIWGDWDSFTFAYKEGIKVTGDFDAQVKIESFKKADGTSTPCYWGRAGLMVREHLGNGSPYAMAGINGGGELLSYSRQDNGTNFWGDSGYPDDGAGCGIGTCNPLQTTPVWVRLTRVGNTYTFYWKKNDGDEWTQLRVHGRAWTPSQLILGFGVQNHNDCRSEAAAVGKFSNLSVTDSTGVLVVDPPAAVCVSGLTAVAKTGAVSATWNVTGDAASIVAERTVGGEYETLELPGALRAADDDTAPDGLVTYKLTPYDAGGVAGGSRRVSLWTAGLTQEGYVTSWVTTPLLNQPYGADPGPDNMMKDYLAEGANGPATEANILPIPGTTINPEYSDYTPDPDIIRAAASSGCNCDTKYGCTCGPLTFLLAQNQTNGVLDCCDYFNCADNVMNYMIAYVTNHTDEDLQVRFNYQTDDAVVIMIDNTVWHMDRVCCYSATGYGFLPPGEHRLMLKIFEGGGGHNGMCRLIQVDGSPFPAGTITSSPYPTMTSVPDAIAPSSGMTMSGFITDWLLIGQYMQSGGCGPSPDFMAQDFLTEGAGGTGMTEANIVPTAGMLVYTDYSVAASDGCQKGTNASATCDPITVLATQAADGRVNFNNLFGDQDNLMAYMVAYVTNNTADYLYCNLGSGSDDSILVKLDNIVVRAVSSCRGYTANQDSGLMALPPGTHRLIAKPFEGGGGFDGGVSLRDWAGGIFAPGVVTVSLTPPDGFTVPPAPACISDLAAAGGAGGVTLTWTNPGGYDAIAVERKAVLTNNWTVIAADLAGDATSFVDADPDTAAAGVYYRVTPKVLDGTVAVCSPVVGLAAPGYVIYQDGMFPTAAYAGTHDAHIVINTPLSNQGASPRMEEGSYNGGQTDQKDALVRFDLDALPEGKEVLAATFAVYHDYVRATGAGSNDHAVYLRALMKAWGEGTGCCEDGPAAVAGEVSWTDARTGEEAWELPGAYGPNDAIPSSPDVSATYGATPATWVTFGGEGVRLIAEVWLDGSFANNGIKITQNPGNEANPPYVAGIYGLASSEYADATLRPILILLVDRAPTVSVATPDPVELCGASVDVALTATAEDPDGDAVTVEWTSTGGTVTAGDPPTSATATFTAVGEYVVTCTVTAGGISTSQDVAVSVLECSGGLSRIGDTNQDGKLDISDPIWLLGHLFLGTYKNLPCDGGTASVPGPGAKTLTDFNADGKIDITDPIAALSFLFTGGAPPALGTGCVRIVGCPDICTP